MSRMTYTRLGPNPQIGRPLSKIAVPLAYYFIYYVLLYVDVPAIIKKNLEPRYQSISFNPFTHLSI
jgi:hypothetical protein